MVGRKIEICFPLLLLTLDTWIGDLFENGPGKILLNGAGLIYNNNSWNNVSSVIYIDSPSFSGFSYGGPSISSSESTATDLYAFLQLFYARFDGFRSLGLHIAGESYAGELEYREYETSARR